MSYHAVNWANNPPKKSGLHLFSQWVKYVHYFCLNVSCTNNQISVSAGCIRTAYGCSLLMNTGLHLLVQIWLFAALKKTCRRPKRRTQCFKTVANSRAMGTIAKCWCVGWMKKAECTPGFMSRCHEKSLKDEKQRGISRSAALSLPAFPITQMSKHASLKNPLWFRK